MRNVSRFILILLVSAGVLVTKPLESSPKPGPSKVRVLKWAVQKTSSLHIQGKSNICSFGCDIQGYYQPDTISCLGETADKAVTLTGSLKIDITKFDCHNDFITVDLRKTLKADTHPTLVIRFLSLERFPVLTDNRDSLKGWVEVELAGISKKFQIDYSFVNPGSSLAQLNGKRTFSFSDFCLTPPKKLAGIIKIKNDFDVDFRLVLNAVNQ